MTMRTVRYFACPKGHQGVEKTSENDQPSASSTWPRQRRHERCNLDGKAGRDQEGRR